MTERRESSVIKELTVRRRVVGINLAPIHAQVKEIDLAVNNGFGFRGINSTIVFVKPKN